MILTQQRLILLMTVKKITKKQHLKQVAEDTKRYYCNKCQRQLRAKDMPCVICDVQLVVVDKAEETDDDQDSSSLIAD